MTNNSLRCLSLCAIAATLLGSEALAIQPSSNLSWGAPKAIRQHTSARAETQQSPAQQKKTTRIIRDASVMAAAWDEDDAQVAEQATTRDHSVVVQRSAPAYDPFDEDDRLAQLPDDPFDESAEESEPEFDTEEAYEDEEEIEPEQDTEPAEDLEAVEEAIEQEIRRRQPVEELLDDETEELLEASPLEEDPLRELNDSDLFDDDLEGESSSEDDFLEPDNSEWQAPDFNIEREYARSNEGLTSEELEEQRRELAVEQQESEANCRQELASLKANKISSIDLDIHVEGSAGRDYPFECAVNSAQHEPRQWPEITYHWKAAALCHKPLYFEQVQLERYGHSWGPYVQPIMSGVHFFGSIPVLPYKMGIRTPCECVYTLGYYRPGSCAPYMIDPIPFTWRAAFFQGAAVTGTAFAIP